MLNKIYQIKFLDKDQRLKKIFLSGSSNILFKFINVITTLISIPLALNYLGSERFGMWMICSSIMSYMSLSDFGLSNSLINIISKKINIKNNFDSKIEISTIFFTLILISVALSFVFFILYFQIKWEIFFNVKSDIAIKESYYVILVLYIFFVINLPLNISQKIRLGFQESHKNNVYLTFGSIISLGLVLLSIFYKLGSQWLIAALMSGILFANVLNYTKLFLIDKKELCPSIKYFRFKNNKKLIKDGFKLFLIQIGSILQFSADYIIIAQILGSVYVTPYAVAKKMFLISQIHQSYFMPMWPAFSEAISKKEYFWAKKFLKKFLFQSILIGMLLGLPIFIFGENIAKIWINQNFELSIFLLTGFFIWTIMINFNGPLSMFLNNQIYLKKQLIMVFLATIGTIMLQIIFCYIFGLNGVIYGAIIPNIIFYIVPGYILALKK